MEYFENANGLITENAAQPARRFHPTGINRQLRAEALAIPAGRHGDLMASLGPALVGGLHVFCLDGGNAFDPLKLTTSLRSRGVNPQPILEERLFVSRAFTCHQLASAVETLFAPLLSSPHPSLAMILEIERLFFDENLPLFERRHLFSRILSTANDLSRRGLSVLMTCGAEPDNLWRATLGQKVRMLSHPEEAAERLRRLADGSHSADIQHLA